MLKVLYNCTDFTCQQDYAQNPSGQALAVCDPRISRRAAGFRNGRGIREQIDNIFWITDKLENSRQMSTSASLTILKPLTVWITINWKILKGMRMPDQLTYLLQNLYIGSNSQKKTQNNRLVPNWERSVSRFYIVILLI